MIFFSFLRSRFLETLFRACGFLTKLTYLLLQNSLLLAPSIPLSRSFPRIWLLPGRRETTKEEESKFHFLGGSKISYLLRTLIACHDVREKCNCQEWASGNQTISTDELTHCWYLTVVKTEAFRVSVKTSQFTFSILIPFFNQRNVFQENLFLSLADFFVRESSLRTECL